MNDVKQMLSALDRGDQLQTQYLKVLLIRLKDADEALRSLPYDQYRLVHNDIIKKINQIEGYLTARSEIAEADSLAEMFSEEPFE